MKKSAIHKLRIDILSGNASVLSMLLCRDGTMRRQGTGKLPAEATTVEGASDGSIFKSLVAMLDEKIFPHANVYDHPNKTGIPVTYSIVFLDSMRNSSVFEFRFGSDTPDVGELLPYFDHFVSRAVQLSDKWYDQSKSQQT